MSCCEEWQCCCLCWWQGYVPPTNLSWALAAEQLGVTHLTCGSFFLPLCQDFDFPYPFYLSFLSQDVENEQRKQWNEKDNVNWYIHYYYFIIIIQRPLGTNLIIALSCSKHLLYLLFSLTHWSSSPETYPWLSNTFPALISRLIPLHISLSVVQIWI